MADYYQGPDELRAKCAVPVSCMGIMDQDGNLTCGRWMTIPKPPINGLRTWYCITHNSYQVEVIAEDVTNQKSIGNLRPCLGMEIRRIE